MKIASKLPRIQFSTTGRQKIKADIIRIEHITTIEQIADLLTKPLERNKFKTRRNKLRLKEVSTQGGHKEDQQTKQFLNPLQAN